MEFERFWSAYPRRRGDQGKPKASEKFAALVKSGVAPDRIVSGAETYARSCRATGRVGTEFVKQASAWLRQRGWEDEYVSASPPGPSVDLNFAHEVAH